MRQPTKALTLALRMAAHGVSLIPVGPDKMPVQSSWTANQETAFTPAELRDWARRSTVTGFAMIGGPVSGGLEIFDFDVPEFYEQFKSITPEWFADLPVQQTGGGGYQVAYRREGEVPGNTKLAYQAAPETKTGRRIAIETRGRGGYALIPGSMHPTGNDYRMLSGDFAELPVITQEQAEQLHDLARSLCEVKKPGEKAAPHRPPPQAWEGDSIFDGVKVEGIDEKANPIDAFNERVSIVEALDRYGYKPLFGNRWARPEGQNPSVTVLGTKSYHHNSNDAMCDDYAHDAFDLFAYFECGDNREQAVRRAAEMLGIAHDSAPKAQRPGSRIVKKAKPQPAAPADEGGPARNLKLEPVADDDQHEGIIVSGGGYALATPIMQKGEVVGHREDRLTNWTWQPEARLAYPGGGIGERGTLTINGRRTVHTTIPAAAWASRQALTAQIGHFGALVMAKGNAEVALLGEHLAAQAEELRIAHGVQTYGLHAHDGTRIELYADGTLGAEDDFEPLFYSGVEVNEAAKTFAMPRHGSDVELQEARDAIVAMPGLVTPATALGLLGYGVAAAFAPRITPRMGKRLPFLYNAGERESGKTSAAQIVLELTTGHTSRITKVLGLTAYQYDRMFGSCNNMLAVLDEYRPGVSASVDTQMRKHHDLDIKVRGQGSKAADATYPLNAPMIVSGEGFSDDPATLSRGVLYYTSKKDRGSVDDYGRLTQAPLWAYSGHLHQLARVTPDGELAARYGQAEELARASLVGTANPRLQYALTFIAFGLLTLQADVSDEAFSDERIAACLAEGVKHTLRGGREGVSNLQVWLGQLNYALTKRPDPRPFVAAGAVPGTLIVKRAAVDLVRDVYGNDAAILNPELLTRYADEAEYVVPGDQHKTHDGRNVRGKRFVLADVPGDGVEYLIDLLAMLREPGIA